jgi:hypothetical protein
LLVEAGIERVAARQIFCQNSVGKKFRRAPTKASERSFGRYPWTTKLERKRKRGEIPAIIDIIDKNKYIF